MGKSDISRIGSHTLKIEQAAQKAVEDISKELPTGLQGRYAAPRQIPPELARSSSRPSLPAEQMMRPKSPQQQT